MSTHHAVFEAFVEAQKALDALPAAQKRVEELERELAQNDERIARQAQLITDLDDANAAKADEILALGNRLDDATFRELEARDALETLVKVVRNSLGTVGDEAQRADLLIHPKPPEPVASEALPPTEPHVEAGHEQVGSLNDHGIWQPLVASAASVNTGLAMTDPASAGDDRLHPSATETGGADTKLGTQGHAGEAGDGGPFAASTEPQSGGAAQGSGDNDAPSSAGVSSSPIEKEYLGTKPYWLKPTMMTWAEWRRQGGLVPSWANGPDSID